MDFGENETAHFLLEQLWLQREMGVFCDLIIYVQGQKYDAHKNILAASSPYLDKLLKCGIVEDKLLILCESLEGFEYFLKYLYTGKVSITDENISELLLFANKFFMDKLKNYCAEYLEQCVNQLNCIKFMLLAQEYAFDESLEKICMFISDHIVDVFKHEEITHLNFNKLKIFLQKIIHLVPQYQVLDSICKWVVNDYSDRERFFKHLLSLLEWKHVKCQFLKNLIKTHTLFQSEKKCLEILCNFLASNDNLKMQFHSSYDFLNTLIETNRKSVIENQDPRILNNRDLKSSENTVILTSIIDDQNSDKFQSKSSINFAESATFEGCGTDDVIQFQHVNLSTVELGTVKKPQIAILSTECTKETSKDISTDLNVLVEVTDFVTNCRPSDKKPSDTFSDNKESNKFQSLLKPLTFCPIRYHQNHISNQPHNVSTILQGDTLIDEFHFSDAEDMSIIHSLLSQVIDAIDHPESLSLDEVESADQNLSLETTVSVSNKDNSALFFLSTAFNSEQPNVSAVSSTFKKSINHKSLDFSGKVSILKPLGLRIAEADVERNPDITMKVLKSSEFGNAVSQQENKNTERDGESSKTVKKTRRKRRIPPKKIIKYPMFKCNICQYKGKTEVFLQHHIVDKHSKPIAYQCDICNFKCNWRKEYTNHMKTHLTGPPFHCDHCEKICSDITTILIHRMKHTRLFPYECCLCSFKTSTKSNLDYHMVKHRGETPYQCEFCGKGFAIKGNLTAHLVTHSDEKNFLCDLCGYSTKVHAQLTIHQRIHGGKQFHCDFEGCDYSTITNYRLKQHKFVHLSERPYKCKTCGKSFVNNQLLKKHEYTHMDPKLFFNCEYCDYACHRNDTFKRHIVKHHSEGNWSCISKTKKCRTNLNET